MNSNTNHNDDPYQLTKYINDVFQSINETNINEHLPTSRVELAMAEKQCHKLYDRGVQLQTELGSDCLERCLKLYKRGNNSDESYDLIKTKVSKTMVIIPRYVKMVEEL